MKKRDNSKKTYGAKGEKYLEDVFKEAIGIGVNQAIRFMMDDIKNMEYGNVYDTHILVNNINLRELTQELQKIQHRREELKEELTLLDSSEKELKEAIERINLENKEYQENKKENRNIKLNDISNKILIEYIKNKDSFDSMDIMRIVDDSEVEESINVVVGYIQNTIKSLNEGIITIHEKRFDGGCRIKIVKEKMENPKDDCVDIPLCLDEHDIKMLIHMLDELRYDELRY